MSEGSNMPLSSIIPELAKVSRPEKTLAYGTAGEPYWKEREGNRGLAGTCRFSEVVDPFIPLEADPAVHHGPLQQRPWIIERDGRVPVPGRLS